ncbi:UNVERIFIED_CONTAM: TOM1-like protein 5 [Sesamum radiatum]|uniref:TOM1-like protein 5 n=1 Tax=Sesamum radiatum TaxID=300843 RepID=A0AAW2RFJ0_SESRA
MASELVSAATSDKLTEMDWTKNIEICELVARDHRQAKDVVKAIKKRLGSKNPNTQLYAVLSDLPVREKIFLLLDAAQTSVGGATGRFPNIILHIMNWWIRKGKACVRPEDEDHQIERPWELMGRPVPGEMLHRPLIRPLTVERQREPIPPSNMEPKQEPIRPLTLELNQPANTAKPAVAIPPPPAKHVEREKFFQENKADPSTLNGHMRGLSLHSRNASSSRSGSIDFSD